MTPAARSYRADGIRRPRLAAYPEIEESRLDGVRYRDDWCRSMNWVGSTADKGGQLPQRSQSYAAEYAGLSTFS